MTIRVKIQWLRKGRGLSQEALATMLYINRQTVSKWELGQSVPDLTLIVRLRTPNKTEKRSKRQQG